MLLLGSYLTTWFFLPQLGLAGPMANLSYFYYGKSHTKSDSALYIAYYPLYWYEMKTKSYSRYGIHWSDRKDPPPPSLSELIKDGVTDSELKDMGFTDQEVKDARQKIEIP